MTSHGPPHKAMVNGATVQHQASVAPPTRTERPGEATILIPEKKQTRNVGKLLPIEGLRVILTFYVLLYHHIQYQGYGAYNQREAERSDRPLEFHAFMLIADAGDTAVTIFFVLAGFVAQLTDRPPPASTRERAAFVAQRFLRLAPAYYTCFLFMVSSKTVGYYVVGAYRRMPEHADEHEVVCSDPFYAVALGTAINELLMVQSWFTWREVRNATLIWPPDCGPRSYLYYEYGFNAVDWFVSALLGCQVLHAFLGAVILKPLSTAARALAAVVAFASLRLLCWLLLWGTPVQQYMYPMPDSHSWSEYAIAFDWLWHWPPACACGYFAGVATGRFINLLPTDGALRSWGGWRYIDSPVVIGWMTLFVVRLGVPWPNSTLAKLLAVYFAPIFCVMTICTHHGPTLRALSHPSLTSLAPIAYAAYLCQWVPGELLLRLRWDCSSPTALLFLVFGSLMLGSAIHWFVDVPLAPLSKQLVERIRGKVEL